MSVVCPGNSNYRCNLLECAYKEIDRLNTIVAKYEPPKIKNGMKAIRIYLKSGKAIDFIGVYRRDLEKDNWHYYETNIGTIIHCRKENMECVEECDIYIKTEYF